MFKVSIVICKADPIRVQQRLAERLFYADENGKVRDS
jgi:hypothetical protein